MQTCHVQCIVLHLNSIGYLGKQVDALSFSNFPISKLDLPSLVSLMENQSLYLPSGGTHRVVKCWVTAVGHVMGRSEEYQHRGEKRASYASDNCDQLTEKNTSKLSHLIFYD